MKALIFLAIVALAIFRPMPHAPQPQPAGLIRPADLDDALNCSLRFGLGRVDWTVVI